MKLTPSQATAVAHRGSNLLVAASAGAGKTEVLARRCVSLIADPQRRCGIDRLLVVTFTRAAAAELRVRIARMLREEADRAGAAKCAGISAGRNCWSRPPTSGRSTRGVGESCASISPRPAWTCVSRCSASRMPRYCGPKCSTNLFDQIHRGGEPLADEAQAWLGARDCAGRPFPARPDRAAQRFPRAPGQPGPVVRAAARDLREPGRRAQYWPRHWPRNAGFQHEQLKRWLGRCRLRPPSCGRMARRWPIGTSNSEARAQLPRSRRRSRSSTSRSPTGERRSRRSLRKSLRSASAGSQQRLQKHVVARQCQVDSGSTSRRPAALIATLLRLEERYQQMLPPPSGCKRRTNSATCCALALDLLGSPAAGRRARTNRDRPPAAAALRAHPGGRVPGHQPRAGGNPATGHPGGAGPHQPLHGRRREAEHLRLSPGRAAAVRRAERGVRGGQAEGRIEYLVGQLPQPRAACSAALNRPLRRGSSTRRLGGTAYGEKERLRAGPGRRRNRQPDAGPAPRVEVHVIEHDARRKRAEAEDADEFEAEVSEREAQLAAEQIRAMLVQPACRCRSAEPMAKSGYVRYAWATSSFCCVPPCVTPGRSRACSAQTAFTA